MILGKRVQMSEPHRLRLFFPDYRMVKEIPILSGKYVFVGDGWSFDRFPRSIWIVRGKADFYLDKVEGVVELLASFRRLTVGVKEKLSQVKDLDECWRRVAEYYYFGMSQEEEVEEKVFKLFTVLNASNKEILDVYSKLKLPRQVILSSLLTMISKSQSYKDYQGQASSNYLRLLYTMNRALKDVKQKFVAYWLSDQSELQFIHLLFSLKR